ncbi:MAG: 3-phosphoshikimate 1-carboxyvinyltransferase [Planctomycetota bacterium]|nr:MAG: 3-phosphoshikimate 1-carboxyvinyltransferase [Planctomycetota bacterium]
MLTPRPLRGEARVPGDKSVTHRALLLGAVASGETLVRGALDALDTRSSARCVRALGARVRWQRGGELAVLGTDELLSPSAPLDCGNAGTAARLLLGLLAGRSGRWALTGDESLRARPMGRVCAPLANLGARIDGERLPLAVQGAPLSGGELRVEVPSAQVKSALLLAGLVCDGPLTVEQPVPTRDHTERMLPAFGVRCQVDGARITLHPGRPAAAQIDVPADPSAAAFLVLAALLTPGSELALPGVGLWPRRTGWLDVLIRAGAPITVQALREDGVDPVGTLHIRAADEGQLGALSVSPHEVPDLVDELPMLALAAARAQGTSRFEGLAELRVKETDRVASIARLLGSLGVPVVVDGDSLSITGVRAFSAPPLRDPVDHRLALCADVARHVSGLSPEPDDGAGAVSWPGFGQVLAGLGEG